MHITSTAQNADPAAYLATRPNQYAGSVTQYDSADDPFNNGLNHAGAMSGPLTGIATGSVIAYSPAHQIACCDSLTRMGFGDIPLSRIEQYVGSAKLWCTHISDLTTDPDCRLFYPDGKLGMHNIYALARFHDSKSRPPIAALGMENLTLSLSLFSRARREHRDLSSRLSTQQYWVDVSSLPLTEQSLRNLYRILQTQHSSSSLRLNRLAIRWLKPFLQPDVVFSTQLACGNVARLTRVIESVLQFQQSREFNRGLGPAFDGIHSDWDCLRAQLGFYSDVHTLLDNAEHAGLLLSNWAEYESRFFSLCRRASKVRRRIHKLNNLVKRQYDTPTESAGYLRLARKSVSRLQIWLAVLRYTSRNSNLTPAELLATLPIPISKELDITV